MTVMVSECLLGHNCKYDGGNNRHNSLIEFLKMVDGVVMSKDGEIVDAQFRKGASAGLEIAQKEKPDIIILKSRSPSCGVKEIYDGTFTGIKIPGMGVFAKMAKEAGLNVVDVEDEECWMNFLNPKTL